MQRRSYSVTLTALEPLRIGGVNDPLSGIDNPVATVGGRLAIPGPSLKGVLRNEVERYVIRKHLKGSRWPDDAQPMQPCIPSTKPTPDEKVLMLQGKYRRAACRYPCKKDDRNRADKRGDPHGICPVCYLFGAIGLTGFIRVPFLFTNSAGNELYSSRLDRGTGAVAEETNRPYQLVPDGAQFSGVLDVLVEDPVLGWRLGAPRKFPDPTFKGDEWLISAERKPDDLIQEFVIDRLQAITLLGGYKSKGFGGVKIKVEPKP